MQVMSPDAQSRLAQLDKARAAIAEAVPSWEIDTPVRSASAGAGTVVAPGIELYRATAQPLGIETRGGLMTTLIERDTRVPARQSERFSTAEDDQTAVEISVFQGPGATVAENRRLVSFQLADLKPAPRGVPDIEVTFDIDASGVLTVSARNVQTGDEQAVTVVDIVGEKTSAAHDTAKGDTAFSTMTPESYVDAPDAAAGEELEPGGGEAMEAG
jgi:molecular chaperone DnaK (HSP70)